jgi:hypothetical protein
MSAVWDDSALIDAFNNAMAKYLVWFRKSIAWISESGSNMYPKEKYVCVCVCYSLKLLEKITMRLLKPSVLQTFPWEMVLLLDLHMLNWCKKEVIKGLGFKQLLWRIWEFEVHYKCLCSQCKKWCICFPLLKGMKHSWQMLSLTSRWQVSTHWARICKLQLWGIEIQCL